MQDVIEGRLLSYVDDSEIETSILIPYKSLSDNLVDTIQESLGVNYNIAFSHYYSDILMLKYDHLFPYVYRNNKILWNVPFEEVSIMDFIETKGITATERIELYVEEVELGGMGDISQFICEIPELLQIANLYIGPISGTITIIGAMRFLISKLKASFGFNKKIASLDSIRDGLCERSAWKDTDLYNVLGTDDIKLIDTIMSYIGYTKEVNTYYRNGEFKLIAQQREEACDSIEDESIEYDDLYEFKSQCKDFNDAYISLLCVDFDDRFSPSIETELKGFQCDYAGLIYIGDRLDFIVPREDISNNIDKLKTANEVLYELTNAAEALVNYLSVRYLDISLEHRATYASIG